MANNRKKVTSKHVASDASKLLRSRTSSKQVKEVTGSALSQRPGKKKPK